MAEAFPIKPSDLPVSSDKRIGRSLFRYDLPVVQIQMRRRRTGLDDAKRSTDLAGNDLALAIVPIRAAAWANTP